MVCHHRCRETVPDRRPLWAFRLLFKVDRHTYRAHTAIAVRCLEIVAWQRICEPEHQIVSGVQQVLRIVISPEGIQAAVGCCQRIHPAGAEVIPCGTIFVACHFHTIAPQPVKFFVVVAYLRQSLTLFPITVIVVLRPVRIH